jgi:hypothetical protein
MPALITWLNRMFNFITGQAGLTGAKSNTPGLLLPGGGVDL